MARLARPARPANPRRCHCTPLLWLVECSIARRRESLCCTQPSAAYLGRRGLCRGPSTIQSVTISAGVQTEGGGCLSGLVWYDGVAQGQLIAVTVSLTQRAEYELASASLANQRQGSPDYHRPHTYFSLPLSLALPICFCAPCGDNPSIFRPLLLPLLPLCDSLPLLLNSPCAHLSLKMELARKEYPAILVCTSFASALCPPSR